MKELKKDFTDEKGIDYTVTLEGNNIGIPKDKKYKLQHEFKNRKLGKGLFTSDIGVNSNGFAGVVGLATIISLAAIVIAYLLWKF